MPSIRAARRGVQQERALFQRRIGHFSAVIRPSWTPATGLGTVVFCIAGCRGDYRRSPTPPPKASAVARARVRVTLRIIIRLQLHLQGSLSDLRAAAVIERVRATKLRADRGAKRALTSNEGENSCTRES